MSAEQSAPPPTAAKSPEGRHLDVFIDFVRECAREAGITRAVTDEEACAVLDRFECPDEEYRPMPDAWESPEFWAELQRRSESTRPRIDAKTVSAALREMWGESQPG